MIGLENIKPIQPTKKTLHRHKKAEINLQSTYTITQWADCSVYYCCCSSFIIE